jgi:hypothetical protein
LAEKYYGHWSETKRGLEDVSWLIPIPICIQMRKVLIVFNFSKHIVDRVMVMYGRPDVLISIYAYGTVLFIDLIIKQNLSMSADVAIMVLADCFVREM